jgi:hypothetical protein
MRQAGGVLGEPCELWVRTGAGEDPGIAFCEVTPTLALERSGYDSRPAALGAGVDDLVDEVDKLLWKANGDLLAHPRMVAKR